MTKEVPLTPNARPIATSTLDLASFEPGKVHRCWLELVEDGLGRPERVPVLIGKGRRPGPVVGLTAAVHGNEINGIPVIHGLFNALGEVPVRGAVVAVLAVNPRGVLARKRRFVDDRDLNHMFPGRHDGNVSQLYAARFADAVLPRLDALLDLHTASTGRVNSLYIRADMKNEAVAHMAYRLRPEIIVHNPATDGTLRGEAARRGIPALTLEVGNPHRFQRDYIRRTWQGIRGVLADLGMVARRPLSPGAAPVLCQSSAWMYTGRGGLVRVLPKITHTVEKGEVIARLRNVWGDVLEEYQAPHHSVVVGHSVDPVSESGGRIVHLGVPVGEDHPFVRRDLA